MADSFDQDCPPAPVPDGALARELPIINRRGLHARASAKFVQMVERYGSDVTVTRCGETVGGRSIMGLLTLAAAQGTTITVTAKGQDASDCLQALDDLLANRFGEDE
ncbi:HPr family phosphocarrier protein [Microvirga sp. 2MCAF38]|uniref:HPr family phosphocarrier protein n=1 Tax=Microvirga sp. 2MCAF38 TaxID=3232989 RepID=UPI003F943187